MTVVFLHYSIFGLNNRSLRLYYAFVARLSLNDAEQLDNGLLFLVTYLIRKREKEIFYVHSHLD